MDCCTAQHTPTIQDTMTGSNGTPMVYTNDIRLTDNDLLMFIIIY